MRVRLALLIAVVASVSCGGCDTIDDDEPWQFDELVDEQLNNGVSNNGATNNGADNNDAVNNTPANNAAANNAVANNTVANNNVEPPNNVPFEPWPTERICDRLTPPRKSRPYGGQDVVRYSIAVGVDGCPMLTFATDGFLVFTRWNGGSWQPETVIAEAAWDHDLVIDPTGAPTLFAEHGGQQGFARLRKSAPGFSDWTELDTSGSRWMWGMRADTADTLVALTATQEYTGTDMAIDVVSHNGADWSWARVNTDFDVLSQGPPRLTFTENGGALLPILQNKGYGPNNGDTNLWLATSDDLAAWEMERIDLGPLNEVRRVFLYRFNGELRLLARAGVAGEDGSMQMIHARRDESGVWNVDRLDDCPLSNCTIGAADVDDRGRLHVARGTADGMADGTFVELGILDDAQWSWHPVGTYEEVPRDIAIDNRVHLAGIERAPTQNRVLVYISVDVR